MTKKMTLIALAALMPAAAHAQAASADVSAGPPGADEPRRPAGRGDWSGYLAVGPGTVPKYAGSDTYRVIPFAAGEVRYRDVSVDVQGLQAHVNPFGDSRLYGGPVLSVEIGRKPGYDHVARDLPRIRTEIDAGAFVGYRLGGDASGQGQLTAELSLLHDVGDVSKGLLATGLLSYTAVADGRWTVSVDGSTTFGDGKYQRTYFGVRPGDALRSGLGAYRPKSGLRDVGGGATASYQLGPRWGLLARAGYTRLIDEAGRSPIAKAGSRDQLLGGVAVSYRF